jgi:hypothetical protein
VVLKVARSQANCCSESRGPCWRRDLSVSHNKIGEVLLAQGNRYAALNVHRTGLSVAEALCRRDPANIQWKVDLAVSYSKLGSLASEIDIQTRRNYLLHGRDILLQLKSVGKLSAAQDYISWFDRALEALGEE